MNYGSTAQAISNQLDEPMRIGQVSNQVERGASLTARLDDVCARLQSRLEPILSTGGPIGKDAATGTAPRPTLVGHATALQNHNDQIETITNGLQEMFERIEL